MAKAPVKKKPPAKKAPAKKTPRPAKDVKAGDLRSQYTTRNLSPQQSAKDLKAGDLRSSYLNRGNRLPVVVEQPKKVRGNPNMARPSSVIKQGYTPGSASRALVPYTAPVNKGSVVGSMARGAARAIGRASPVGALIGMTTEAGPGSDKPSGKLFSPSQNRDAGKGNPKAVNPYKKRKDVVGRNPNEGMGVPSAKSAASAKIAVARDSYFTDVPSYKGTKKSGSYFKDVPSYTGVKPSASTANASEFKKKNLKANQKVGKKVMASESTAKAPKAPSFKGNWTGATPNEMQKKGGQRIKRPNLLSLFRGKR
jgi:hypothetical protein